MTQCRTCRQIRQAANSIFEKVGLTRFKFSVGEKPKDLTFTNEKVKNGTKKD